VAIVTPALFFLFAIIFPEMDDEPPSPSTFLHEEIKKVLNKKKAKTNNNLYITVGN
jgi:hypothetical protein